MQFLEILYSVLYVAWSVFFPLLMVTQMAMSIWLIGVELFRDLLAAKEARHDAYHLSTPASAVSTAAAITILVLLVLSLALWMIPMGYCLWSSRFVARFRYTAADAQDCIQVQDSSGQARYCDICNIFQHDRMYHDSTSHKCLPLTDDFCPWWSGTVWSHNKKAYLLFLLALLVHLAFCLGVAVWVFVDSRYDRNPQVAFFFVDGFFVLLVSWQAYAFWSKIAFHNVSSAEYEAKTIWYRLPSGAI